MMMFFIEKWNMWCIMMLTGSIFLLLLFLVCRFLGRVWKKRGYLKLYYGVLLSACAGALLFFLCAVGSFLLPFPCFVALIPVCEAFFSDLGWGEYVGISTSFFSAWLTGAVYSIHLFRQEAKRMQNLYRFGRLVQDLQTRQLLFRMASRLRIAHPPVLFWNPAVSVPFLKGIRTPMILLPVMPLSRMDQKLIFLHELNHQKRKDLIVRLFVQVIFLIYWFLPLYCFFAREIEEMQETFCDIAVCRLWKKESDPAAYYNRILFLTAQKKAEGDTFLEHNKRKEKSQLEKRVCNMLYYQERQKRQVRRKNPDSHKKI